MVHVVEVLEDGSEEDLTSCMDVELKSPTPGEMSWCGESLQLKEHVLAPVRPLLRLKTVVSSPCMLWVDGVLSPALTRPLFINLPNDGFMARPKSTSKLVPGEIDAEQQTSSARKSDMRSCPVTPGVLVSSKRDSPDDELVDGDGDMDGLLESTNLKPSPSHCHPTRSASAVPTLEGSPGSMFAAATLAALPALPAKRTRSASTAGGSTERAQAQDAKTCPDALVGANDHLSMHADELTDVTCDWQLEASSKRIMRAVAPASIAASGRCSAGDVDSKTPIPQIPQKGALTKSTAEQQTIAQLGDDITTASRPQPLAPPPSPIVGRPAPCNVFGTGSKRKHREEMSSMMRNMENSLHAMQIEPRPSKFVRCIFA